MKTTIHIKLLTIATCCAFGILQSQDLQYLAAALKQIEENITESKSSTTELEKKKQQEELERIEKERIEQEEKKRLDKERLKRVEEQLKKEEKQQVPKAEQYKKIIEKLDPNYLKPKGEDATEYPDYKNPKELDIETQDDFIAIQWDWNTLNNDQKVFLAKQFGASQEQREEAKIIKTNLSNPEKLKEELQEFNENKLEKHAQKLLEKAQEQQPEKSFEELLGKKTTKELSPEMRELLKLSPTQEVTGEGKKKTFTTKDPNEAPWINISEKSGDTIKKQFLAEYWNWDDLGDHQKIFLADNIKPFVDNDWLTPNNRKEVDEIKLQQND